METVTKNVKSKQKSNYLRKNAVIPKRANNEPSLAPLKEKPNQIKNNVPERRRPRKNGVNAKDGKPQKRRNADQPDAPAPPPQKNAVGGTRHQQI